MIFVIDIWISILLKGVGAQHHLAQLEEGGEERGPQHPHPPQHGR